MKTMRILVTGGAGFIGSNLVSELHRRGHEVTVLDTLSSQIHGSDPERSQLFRSIRGKARFIRGSVTNHETLEAAMKGQEVIIHFAAETGTGQSMYMIEHYAEVNIQATAKMLNILAANKDHGVKRMLVASSRSIYGEGKYLDSKGQAVYPGPRKIADMEANRFELYDDAGAPLKLVPTDETARIHPSSVYGITKQVQEQLVMTVCPTIRVEPVALRYQNVYGPGQSLSNPYTGILSIFSNLILGGNEINVFEDGLESRDFVFIDDVVAATVLAVEHEGASGEVFNVGSGEATTVLTVVEHLRKHLDEKATSRISGEFRLGDIRHNVADLTHISETLGFKARVPFSVGIGRFAEWVSDRGPEKSAYEDSLSEMRKRGLIKGRK